jgi:WD40 repeat protein
MPYKAFISYSHAADGKLAPAVQSALHRFAKPWNRLRALRVFRDKTSLSANPALWASIEKALSESEYFILMASPEAAASPWVQKEVTWWLQHNRADRILISLTDGKIVWDASTNDFDWSQTSALPETLKKTFTQEPFYIDLSWAKKKEHLSMRQPEFREAIARLAATLHDKPLDEITGEDIRQHRKTIRLVCGVAVVLLALTILSIRFAVVAENRRQVALARQLAGQARFARSQRTDLLQVSMLLGVESMRRSPTSEGEQVLRSGVPLLFAPVMRIEAGSDVRSVLFSPDGTVLLAASTRTQKDGASTLFVLDAVSGKELAQMRMEGTLQDMAFSSDSRCFAVADTRIPDGSSTVLVFDLPNIQERSRIMVTGEVAGIAMGPDAATVATVSNTIGQQRSGVLTVWATESGKKIFQIPHAAMAWAVGFSPNKRFIAMGEGNMPLGKGAIAVYDAATGGPIARMQHAELVRKMAFSPDGRWILAASGEGAHRWETTTGKPAGRFVLKDLVEHVAFSPDGRLIVAAGHGGAAVWNGQTGKQLAKVAHEDEVSSLAISSDGRWLATGGRKMARVWETRTGREVACLTPDMEVQAVAFSPDGQKFATAGRDLLKNAGAVWLWNVPRVTEISQMDAQDDAAFSRFSTEGRLLADARDTVVQIVDTDTGHVIARLVQNDHVAAVVFSPDSQWIATTGARTVRVWETKTSLEISKISPHIEAVSTKFSQDGRRLAISSGRRFGGPSGIEVWDLISGKTIFTSSYDHPVQSFAFNNSGDWLAVGIGQTVQVVDILTGGEVDTIETGDFVRDLSFDPKGTLLAVACGDLFGGSGKAQIWKLSGAKKIVEMVHEQAVWKSVFSPRGDWLLTVSGQEVRVWDVQRGTQLARISSPNISEAVFFSRNGSWIKMVAADGKVHEWPVRPHDLIVESCTRLTRNLTCEEWRQYLGSESYRATCPDLPAPKDCK